MKRLNPTVEKLTESKKARKQQTMSLATFDTVANHINSSKATDVELNDLELKRFENAHDGVGLAGIKRKEHEDCLSANEQLVLKDFIRKCCYRMRMAKLYSKQYKESLIDVLVAQECKKTNQVKKTIKKMRAEMIANRKDLIIKARKVKKQK